MTRHAPGHTSVNRPRYRAGLIILAAASVLFPEVANAQRLRCRPLFPLFQRCRPIVTCPPCCRSDECVCNPECEGDCHCTVTYNGSEYSIQDDCEDLNCRCPIPETGADVQTESQICCDPQGILPGEIFIDIEDLAAPFGDREGKAVGKTTRIRVKAPKAPNMAEKKVKIKRQKPGSGDSRYELILSYAEDFESPPKELDAADTEGAQIKITIQTHGKTARGPFPVRRKLTIYSGKWKVDVKAFP